MFYDFWLKDNSDQFLKINRSYARRNSAWDGSMLKQVELDRQTDRQKDIINVIILLFLSHQPV